MAQTRRVNRRPSKKPRPPLDGDSLEQLALFYVGRYATTRAKLRSYLSRKIRERGWDGERNPEIASLAQKFADLGYIDDGEFAKSRAASLGRRGYGARRVEQALYAAGIEEGDGREARELAENDAWKAAEAFARKRRFGPFAERLLDEDKKRKATAAMLRAGHSFDITKKFIDSEPGVMPEKED